MGFIMRIISFVARVTSVTLKCVILTGEWKSMFFHLLKACQMNFKYIFEGNIIAEIASIIFYFENGIKYVYKN